MFLTEEEKRRFVEYLEQDATSNELLATQMEKSGVPIPELLARFRNEAKAARIIIKSLLARESMTIKGA